MCSSGPWVDVGYVNTGLLTTGLIDYCILFSSLSRRFLPEIADLALLLEVERLVETES